MGEREDARRMKAKGFAKNRHTSKTTRTHKMAELSHPQTVD